MQLMRLEAGPPRQKRGVLVYVCVAFSFGHDYGGQPPWPVDVLPSLCLKNLTAIARHLSHLLHSAP